MLIWMSFGKEMCLGRTRMNITKTLHNFVSIWNLRKNPFCPMYAIELCSGHIHSFREGKSYLFMGWGRHMNWIFGFYRVWDSSFRDKDNEICFGFLGAGEPAWLASSTTLGTIFRQHAWPISPQLASSHIIS